MVENKDIIYVFVYMLISNLNIITKTLPETQYKCMQFPTHSERNKSNATLHDYICQVRVNNIAEISTNHKKQLQQQYA